MTMQAERFTVKYVTVQNCFIYLPDAWHRRLTTKSGIAKVTHEHRDFYFSWHSRHSADGFLNLSATFARALGFQEGDDILVSCELQPASVANVVVVPRSSQDWEIVELQSTKIQESLLSQINIVAVNQEIVVWVSRSLSIVLSVESLEPSYKYGRLEQFTEISVSLPKNKKEGKRNFESKNSGEKSKNKVWDFLKNLVPEQLSGSQNLEAEKVEESVEEILQRTSKKYFVQTFRVLPLQEYENADEMSTADSLLRQPYNIFIHRCFLPSNFSVTSSSKEIYCRVKKVKQNVQFVKVTNSNFLRDENASEFILATEIVARLFVLEDLLRNCSNNINKEYFVDNSVHQSIYVSKNLRHNLKLKIGAKVTLELIKYSEGPITALKIIPLKNLVSQQDVEKYFEERSKYNKLLLNSSTELILSNEKSCRVQILPLQTLYALIDTYDLRNIMFHINDVVPSSENQMENLEQPEGITSLNVSMCGLKSILSDCQCVLKLSLGIDRTSDSEYDRENILICGKVGSGKTTICQILREAFSEHPNFVYVQMIDAKALKGKKVEILHKTFLSAIVECTYYQPSILFIDNLESIAGRALDDEENTPNSINTARTADMLIKVITECQMAHYVSVVATCKNTNKLNRKIVAPRGIHFFRTILSLPELEKEDRVDILKLALNKKLKVSNGINWDHYGNKTEGWMAQDLINFADKAAFTAWKRHVQSGSKVPLILYDEDLSKGLESSMPISLQGINLYSGPGHAWSDIGGLAEVKQSLIELLHWPLKYQELFKNAPIKHQGGVLLYGAPGTGKTMLAGAIARECGLNFISVKGPELLSKYIGASEEAVRNVFEKANSAKPCVLFFDEFDSLAPRRGHDSTGVTDRVVNQFLAQLDGVEGREGVAVVAASSRPDLLDPALLRPGRLDKSLFCPLPNEDEREEILTALCRSQKLDTSSLDFKTLAAQTDGFSGADLNAIISQGKICALEENLAELKLKGEKNSGVMNANVTQRHLIEALACTGPSLSASEKFKYDKIYAKFSRAEDITVEIVKNNQRATLA
ncbi:peroxisome biogenesis factor 1 isoform X1 [Athalia rosae]|uniref:peroxisome biogenesis factor 1 isoform X1 n=1 Tax=Athalia rosae TaxID=37344 RepID=UPI0020338351|nr:peroxisome biogenesis factor 1 isoform X1 [Athalia rosae]